MLLQYLPLSLGSIQLTIWEEILLEDFQYGRCGCLGYRNEMILAILNLYVSRMPFTKFQLNPTYDLVGDVVWIISRWPRWRPSWISEWSEFSTSESLCRSDAFHQISAQPNLLLWRRYHLKNFKMAILDIGTERFCQIWVSMSLWCLPSSYSSIRLTVWKEILFEQFQNDRRGGHLGYRNGTILAIQNLFITAMPPIKQEGPEGPYSLTWVSLSLVYFKRLWFLFIQVCMFKICSKECFPITGWGCWTEAWSHGALLLNRHVN